MTGLQVAKHPHHSLKLLYEKILRTLNKIPEDATYRINTEQIVKQKLALVNSESNVQKLEEIAGSGQVEEMILQAHRELSLSRKMLEWRPWEPLIAEAPKNQWKWPVT